MEIKGLVLVIGALMGLLTLLFRIMPNPNTTNKDVVFCGFITSAFVVGGLFPIVVFQVYLMGGMGLLILARKVFIRFDDWLELLVKK